FARIDARTGAGMGLWTRPASGGDAHQLELPGEPGTSPTPAQPSATAAASPQPVLRAPRYSPDGQAVAFVDVSGRVGVLELPDDRLTLARFAAVDAPEWLPDSSGVLLSGSPGGALEPVTPGQPLRAFDAGSLGLSSFELGGLRLARLDRGAAAVQLLDQVAGAARPQAGEVGRYLFIQVQPGAPEAAGRLLLSNASGTTEMLAGGGPPVTSAGFGPQARNAVAARLDAGIWLVDVAAGEGTQLTSEGWLPSWLP
ncbi:MAG TPA: hypothetical protein VF153_04025, partial [Candidatus Limnocylindria bacterium]